MQKHLILAVLAALTLTGCNQDSNQANILNTTSLTPQNYDITTPAPQNSPVITDNDGSSENERNSLVNTMLQTIKKLESDATNEGVEKLIKDQQKLRMTDPYESKWQQQMDTLNNQLIQLEVIVRDHKDGLAKILEQIKATLQNL